MKLGTTLAPRRPGHLAVANMLAAMSAEPQTVADLMFASGLCDTTLRAYILTFRKLGIVYLAEWQENVNGRRNSPAFRLGVGTDAPRPRPLSRAGRTRKLHERAQQMQTLAALTGRLRQTETEPA